MRQDLTIIANWVKPKSRVLDLACGDGELLHYLEEHKSVTGYGLEIDAEQITACIARGVDVLEQDLNRGLSNFANSSYDTVIMTQALQVLRRQDLALEEMLRVGQEAIVTFPNFAHWTNRFYLSWKGQMPMSKTLPHQWYDTPNIHLFTFKDFEALCHEKGIKILDRTVGDFAYKSHWKARLLPNLFGEVAIYRIGR
ncbi:methionine biosynthesis protein MetW [Marinospirillum minutulum]|uniref:methionine biosynthesis protein MetW n=1 Tax=Marinospirillum minutulum TaxID=64974 RepID=UPI0004066EA1|nr:methionine biosynthesis protein MetW [Marinospirillum minutulum]